MDNKTVSEIFNTIYNGFWMKHRDTLPTLQDEDAWNALREEGNTLIKRYDCQLATDMVLNLLIIMDQRVRRRL